MVSLLKIRLFGHGLFGVDWVNIWVSIYDFFGPGRPVTHQNVRVSNSKKFKNSFFFF